MNTLRYAPADNIYLSQEMGMRKPEARIYQASLRQKVFADDAVFLTTTPII
jgi:putative hydrolase of the HAD superfamily